MGDAKKDGMTILDCFSPKDRLSRLLVAPLFVIFKAISLKSDIFHLHGPELLLLEWFQNFVASKLFLILTKIFLSGFLLIS